MLNLDALPAALQPTAKRLAENISFDNFVKKGGNGYVLIGRNRLLAQDVVVKFYYWGGGDHAEPALLASLNCPNILQVLYAEKINNDDAFFVTPFCEMGDLDDALEQRNFGPLQAVDVLLQIAAGVSYLHAKRLLHRDLKASNVFCLANGCFVIGDFGSVVSQNAEGCAITLTRHSLLYRPPEEILTRSMSRQSDIYQLGLLLFQVLGGSLPYDECDWLSGAQKVSYALLPKSDRQLFATKIIEDKICRGKILNFSSLPPWVPVNLKNIVRQACALNAGKRYETVADMAASLSNLRSGVPDWRIEEDPVLFRKKKMFRITRQLHGLVIEKNVGGGWRTEQRFKPKDMSEAVAIAESL